MYCPEHSFVSSKISGVVSLFREPQMIAQYNYEKNMFLVNFASINSYQHYITEILGILKNKQIGMKK